LAISDTVETLVLDLLEWVGFKERTYDATMEAWRTSCTKLQIWEDANDRGLVETACVNGESFVRVTAAGLGVLQERRPRFYDQLLYWRQQSE
jgi:trans-aconitate 2-methyltransferase